MHQTKGHDMRYTLTLARLNHREVFGTYATLGEAYAIAAVHMAQGYYTTYDVSVRL